MQQVGIRHQISTRSNQARSNIISTRSMVGVGTPEQFEGRYCHSDGYPSGVGKALYDNWKRFDWNLGRLAEFVMMTKQGWSHLCDTNFNLKPKWYEYTDWDTEHQRPRWYDDRSDEYKNSPPMIISHENILYGDMEWGYLINLDENRIDVYEIHNKDQLIFKGSMIEAQEPDYQALEK